MPHMVIIMPWIICMLHLEIMFHLFHYISYASHTKIMPHMINHALDAKLCSTCLLHGNHASYESYASYASFASYASLASYGSHAKSIFHMKVHDKSCFTWLQEPYNVTCIAYDASNCKKTGTSKKVYELINKRMNWVTRSPLELLIASKRKIYIFLELNSFS